MDYTRTEHENIVIGMLLNDFDGMLMDGGRLFLREELFVDKKNKFIYGIIDKMHRSGERCITPCDVFRYANDNSIAYGDMSNFASYMCELALTRYSEQEFKRHAKELVRLYIRDKKYGSR